jgi:hypothetical protein
MSIGNILNGTIYQMWHGQPVNSDDVLLDFTYLGDTNLDGEVNVADLANLSGNFGSTGTWIGGDSNHDGVVNINDLSDLAGNLNNAPQVDLGLAQEGTVYWPVVPADQFFDKLGFSEIDSWEIHWGDGTIDTPTVPIDDPAIQIPHNYGATGWKGGYAVAISATGLDANGDPITREVPHIDLSVQPSAPTISTADYGVGGTSASLSWTVPNYQVQLSIEHYIFNPGETGGFVTFAPASGSTGADGELGNDSSPIIATAKTWGNSHLLVTHNGMPIHTKIPIYVRL